jgi:hypothetical protein
MNQQNISASDPILVWSFDKAPKWIQELSRNGGDEDWVALIPNSLGYKIEGDLPSWLFGKYFAICDAEVHLLDSGDWIVIGSHA